MLEEQQKQKENRRSQGILDDENEGVGATLPIKERLTAQVHRTSSLHAETV